MIGKLICYGRDRRTALERAYRAVSEYIIRGPKTTLPLYKAVFKDPIFLQGKATTAFLDDFLLRNPPGGLV
jgi:acetyl-CoA carboxylase biotin carboxylase subunit